MLGKKALPRLCEHDVKILRFLWEHETFRHNSRTFLVHHPPRYTKQKLTVFILILKDGVLRKEEEKRLGLRRRDPEGGRKQVS